MSIRSVLVGLAFAIAASVGLSPGIALASDYNVLDPSALAGDLVVSPVLLDASDYQVAVSAVTPAAAGSVTPFFESTNPFASFVASASMCLGGDPGGGSGDDGGGEKPGDTESSDLIGCGTDFHLRL